MLTDKEFNEMTEKVYAFHHKRAPGIPIGVAMVDLALDKLGVVKEKINAIAETQACLSDVIQIMAGCTIGNRYLRIYKELGKYALTLFDRADGRGVRVFIDIDKIDASISPETYKFFHRTRSAEVKKGGPARIESSKKIVKEFLKIKDKILDFQEVKVINHGKPPMLPASICITCGESFLAKHNSDKKCQICSGALKYFELK